MGRPPLPLGTAGKIRTHKTTRTGPDGKTYISWRAMCSYRYPNGETKPIERRGRTETAAKKALNDALRTLAARSRTPQRVKLRPDSRYEEALQVYLAKGKWRGTTYDRYASHVRRHLIPRMGQVRLQEIDVPVIEDVLEVLAEEGKTGKDGPGPLAANTLRQIRVVIHDSLQVAVSHGAIPSNPAEHLTRIKGEPRRPSRALSPEERHQLLDDLDADKQAVAADLPALLRFLAGTGVRLGEAVGLRWCDLNLDETPVVMEDPVAGRMKVPPRSAWINGNIVEITGKGLTRHEGKTFRAQRVIGLPEWLVLLLQLRWADDEYAEAGPVFPSEAGGWRWLGNTRRAIRAFRSRAGYDWMTSHTFRRTVATVLDELGLTARQIADHLGHAQVSMTQDVYMGRGQADPAVALALDRALGRRADNAEGLS